MTAAHADGDLWSTLGERIAAATGTGFAIRNRRAVGGGCINDACVVDDGRQRYFVKLNTAQRGAMFEAEYAGLEEIRRSDSLRAPAPICWGTAHGRSYLVLEYLELGGAVDGARLGRGLAGMHRATRRAYGWIMDNTIGSTPQPNGSCPDWVVFWRERRLGFQLELAARNGHGGRLQRRGERLLERLPALLSGHAPAASLLHGDLWSGNYAGVDGEPVLFDPAVYFGDREADIAMTELFGGFPVEFYRAYAEAYPLPPEYPSRKTLYNLYHVLNHLNLFGGGYRAQAEHMIDALLGELG